MKRHALQLARFSAVSIFCFALGLSVLTGLHELAGVHYLVAYVASFVVTSTLGYLLNGQYTFCAGTGDSSGLVRYMTVNVCLLLINGMALRLLVEQFHIWYLEATLLLAVLNTPVSFLAHRIVSYRLGRQPAGLAIMPRSDAIPWAQFDPRLRWEFHASHDPGLNMTNKFDRYLSTHFAAMGDAHRNTHRLEAIRANYAKLIPADKSAAVLEIGPGMGELLHYLVVDSGLRNVEAIDLSAEVAAYCSERYCHTALVEDPIAFLEARAKRYELIMLLHVLEHVEKAQALPFLRAIRSALAPGGRIVIEVPNMANPLVGLRYRYADFTHELGFTGTSLAQLLRLAGFDSVIVRPFRIPVSSVPRIAQFILRGCLESSLRLLTRLYTTDVEINSANLVAIAS
jgi:2-polyprenyl-3-methyl-5-hydroxy-6-metoxy-1,4-benzoquinol methylase/putative flippase GtrA